MRTNHQPENMEFINGCVENFGPTTATAHAVKRLNVLSTFQLPDSDSSLANRTQLGRSEIVPVDHHTVPPSIDFD